MSRLRNQRQEEKVIAYFRETDSSYKNWANREAYFLHYGYHDRPGMSQYEALVRMNEIMAEQVKMRPGLRILDAGCGVSATAIWLAQKYGAEVHGITLSPLQARKARAFARDAKLEKKALFYVKSFLNTGFPGGSFDIVWVQESSSQTFEKKLLLKESSRVLVPGGRVIVTDLFLVRDKLRETEKFCIDKWCDGWAMAYLPTVREFRTAMCLAGFSHLQIFDNTEKIRESAERIYQRGKDGYPDDLLTKAKTVMRIRHTEANMFQKIALEMKLWRHLSFVGQKPLRNK